MLIKSWVLGGMAKGIKVSAKQISLSLSLSLYRAVSSSKTDPKSKVHSHEKRV